MLGLSKKSQVPSKQCSSIFRTLPLLALHNYYDDRGTCFAHNRYAPTSILFCGRYGVFTRQITVLIFVAINIR